VSPRLLFRSVAIAEAVTWTLLIAGMILKSAVKADFGDTAVSIAGGLHGFVFLAYALTVLIVGVNQRWRVPVLAAGVISAVIPYAAVAFEIWADRTGRLTGPWLRTATADRRDHTWYAKLLRWMLAHPVILIVSAVILLAVVMTVLLIAGPPVSLG
jgi:integral membrane protein